MLTAEQVGSNDYEANVIYCRSQPSRRLTRHGLVWIIAADRLHIRSGLDIRLYLRQRVLPPPYSTFFDCQIIRGPQHTLDYVGTVSSARKDSERKELNDASALGIGTTKTRNEDGAYRSVIQSYLTLTPSMAMHFVFATRANECIRWQFEASAPLLLIEKERRVSYND